MIFIVSKQLLYIKTFIVFLFFLATIWYLGSHANLTLINIILLQSLVSFLNDMNSNSNILEYVALLFIKLVFNVDIHQLRSFFDNINPLFK